MFTQEGCCNWEQKCQWLNEELAKLLAQWMELWMYESRCVNEKPQQRGQSLHVQQFPGYRICQPSQRGFTHPFSWEKEAASSHLAHYETPLINLFKTSYFLNPQAVIKLSWCSWVILNSPALLLGSLNRLLAPGCIQPAPLPTGNSTCGRLGSSCYSLSRTYVFFPQVWTSQDRVITQILQVPKGSVDCFRESVKTKTFLCVEMSDS